MSPLRPGQILNNQLKELLKSTRETRLQSNELGMKLSLLYETAMDQSLRLDHVCNSFHHEIKNMSKESKKIKDMEKKLEEYQSTDTSREDFYRELEVFHTSVHNLNEAIKYKNKPLLALLSIRLSNTIEMIKIIWVKMNQNMFTPVGISVTFGIIGCMVAINRMYENNRQMAR